MTHSLTKTELKAEKTKTILKCKHERHVNKNDTVQNKNLECCIFLQVDAKYRDVQNRFFLFRFGFLKKFGFGSE